MEVLKGEPGAVRVCVVLKKARFSCGELTDNEVINSIRKAQGFCRGKRGAEMFNNHEKEENMPC